MCCESAGWAMNMRWAARPNDDPRPRRQRNETVEVPRVPLSRHPEDGRRRSWIHHACTWSVSAASVTRDPGSGVPDATPVLGARIHIRSPMRRPIGAPLSATTEREVREKHGGSRPEVDTERGVARTALWCCIGLGTTSPGRRSASSSWTSVPASSRCRRHPDARGAARSPESRSGLPLERGAHRHERARDRARRGTAAPGTGTRHAMKALADLACAATPIVDPRSGRPVGVVAAACRIDASSELMLSYVRQIGRQIEDSLVDDSSVGSVRRRRTSSAPAGEVGGATRWSTTAPCSRTRQRPGSSTTQTAASLSGMGARGDRARPDGRRGIHLATGSAVTARCEPVDSGARIVGALVRLDPASRALAQRLVSRRPRVAAHLRVDQSSPSQLGIAELVASGMTNQEVATRLSLRGTRSTSTSGKLFSKLGIDSRVELARHVSLNQEDQRRTA